MEVKFYNPSLDDVMALVPLIRADDRKEVERLGNTIEQALAQSFRDSDHLWLAELDGKPACIIGIGTVSYIGNVGTPWFLTTDVMETMAAKRALLAYSPVFVADFLEKYDNLVNYVDARYIRALRWLKWLGFTIGEIERSSITGHPFRRVSMERKIWAS